MISSLAPDPAVITIILLSTALWVRSARFAPHALTLACFAMTIKLSAAPLLVGAAAATFAWAIRAPRGALRGLAPVAWFCVASAAIFFVRGVWLSGYPAFPSSIGRFAGLSWTAPPQLAQHVQREIEFWSRYRQVYEIVTPGMPWFAGWVRRVGFSQPMGVAALVFITGTGCWSHRRPRFASANTRTLIAMLAMLPAIVFWFVAAPQPRFGYGYLFGAASLALAAGLSGYVPRKLDLPVFRLVLAGGILGMLLLTGFDLQLRKATLLRWPQIPTARLQMHRTVDGIIVYTPLGDDRVWAAPLPATPELNPELRCQRDAGGQIRRFWVEMASSPQIPPVSPHRTPR